MQPAFWPTPARPPADVVTEPARSLPVQPQPRRGAAVVPGSGVMMLTGGVEAAVGNSALVGLPVGIDGTSGAKAATGAGVVGAFQVGA